MALLLTSVFGVTGCGSDDDVQAESRIKNSTGDNINDINDINRPTLKVREIDDINDIKRPILKVREIDDLRNPSLDLHDDFRSHHSDMASYHSDMASHHSDLRGEPGEKVCGFDTSLTYSIEDTKAMVNSNLLIFLDHLDTIDNLRDPSSLNVYDASDRLDLLDLLGHYQVVVPGAFGFLLNEMRLHDLYLDKCGVSKYGRWR